MIAAFTSARSDWYLLEPVLKKISPPPQLIACGSHFSRDHGNTSQDIDYPIAQKYPCLFHHTEKSNLGYLISCMRNWCLRNQPACIILLGDRYETFGAAAAAYSEQIPIIHIHAGEQTPYAPDNAYRTCITALASLCFAPTRLAAEHARKINPRADILTVGAVGAEIAANLKLYGREELIQKGFHLEERTFLVTWNPQPGEDVAELIAALEESGAEVIWTYPGADPGYKEIIEKIEQTKFQLHPNLGQKTYLSLAKQCTAVVGNSSSGIIEVPTLNIPVINIGLRQLGRERNEFVFLCECGKSAISVALKETDWPKSAINPYYQPGTIQTIAEEIMKRYA